MNKLKYILVSGLLIISTAAVKAARSASVKYSHSRVGDHPTGRDSRKKKPAKIVKRFTVKHPGKTSKSKVRVKF